MSEAVVVGYFSDSIESGALTGVDLELRALELVAHWRRCGHTADWLARFFSYDFDLETREAATSVLSTVINELLENSAKFCADKQKPVRVGVHHHGEFLVIETRNVATDVHATSLRTAIEDLERGSLAELFARRMQERSASGASGIGLLIIKKDYGARLGAKLVRIDANEWDVRVRVELGVDEVEQR